MSAPTASGLFHVSSSAPSLPSSILFSKPIDDNDDSNDSKQQLFDTTNKPQLPPSRTYRRDPLLVHTKAATTRSKSFIQKPVVLFPTSTATSTTKAAAAADDRSSSGSDSSTTSTASTGSHPGGTDDSSNSNSNTQRSSLHAPPLLATASTSTSTPPTGMAPIHPPLSYHDPTLQVIVDKPPPPTATLLPRKSIRKSASNILASSLGIVGGSASSSNSALTKSYSAAAASPTAAITSPSGQYPPIPSMPSPSSSSSHSIITSPTGSQSLRHQRFSHSSDASSSSSVVSHPLLELSPDRQVALTEFIDKAVDDAYNLCHGYGRIRWHAFKTRDGVSICRAHGEDEQRLDAAVRGTCNVTATFEELLDALITQSTDSFQQHESTVNPSEFLDGRILATLVPRTADDRFVCLKWHAIKSLAPSVAKHRDYVYVEVVDQFIAHDGKRVGYRLAKSIELDELRLASPTLTPASQLCVRAKTLTVQTFTEVAPGNLELLTMMINDLGERLPTWLVHKIVDTAALRVATLRDHLNHRRLELLVFANARDVVPLAKRSNCIVCTKSFSLVRKKYNCVACGDVMCTNCSVHQLVAPAVGLSEFVGKRKAKICVKCSSGLSSRELPRRSMPSSTTLRVSDVSSDRSTVASSDKPTTRRPGSMLESRNNRTMSAVDGFVVGKSDDDEATATNNRPSPIPHMFQFRPAPAKPEPRAVVASAIEPVALSEPAEPVAMTRSLSTATDNESEEDDDMEHELFDTTVDIRAIAPQQLDLGVGRYKDVYVQQSQSERAVDSFLLGNDDDDGPEVASFLTQECVVEHLASLSSSAAVLTTMEELIVEEMIPGNAIATTEQPRASLISRASLDLSTGRSSRSSLAVGTTAAAAAGVVVQNDDDDDAPVIVRKVEKLSIGAGGRKSREVKRPRAPPPPPIAAAFEATAKAQADDALATETETADFTADFTVEIPAAPAAPIEPVPTIQLEDLQVHLDRMAQISASLKSLNVHKIESSTEATNAMRRLASFEKRANAEVAAGIAASFVSSLEKNALTGSMLDRPVYVPAAIQPTGPPRFILTLAMGDGSIVDYLRDSVFDDLQEPVDGALAGWQTVQSRATGKVYYYNATCGATSWTLPTAEMHRGAVYMVL